ncbi:MAG: LamG-like jellyroll fold domain-containing protein, partial [Acidobacteriota bacterium]
MNIIRFNLRDKKKNATTSRMKPSLSGALFLFTPKLQKLFALLLLLPLIAVSVQGDGRSEYGLPKQNQAFYLGWQGYIDTQLDFSQFFNADHTIMAWFMPQYPYAYEGPIFAENGNGTYAIGQGNYRAGNGGYKDEGDPVFQMQIGDKKVLYLVPDFKESALLKVHPWVHVAVVRQNNKFKLYVDGSLRTPIKIIDRTVIEMGFLHTTDKVKTWFNAAKPTVWSGKADDLDQLLSSSSYTLPPGKTPADIVGISFDSSGRVYAWYDDGTFSKGREDDLDYYLAPSPYALPPGKTPADIVGVGIRRSTDRVYTWYDDGTYSGGTPNDLGQYLASSPYTMPSGKTIVGVDIARSNDDHVYAWYDDGTFSEGTRWDLDYYQNPSAYTSPPKGNDMVAPDSEID